MLGRPRSDEWPVRVPDEEGEVGRQDGKAVKDRQVLRPAEASAETKILSGLRSALSTGPTQGPSEQQGLANGTKTHQKSPWKVALLIQGRPLDSQSYLLCGTAAS